MMNKIIILLFALVFVRQISAQDFGEIVTDRPDQTESAVTVPKGTVQIELGTVYESDKIKSTSLLVPGYTIKTLSIPGVLVRWGILKNVELRFGAEYLSQSIDYAGNNLLLFNETESGLLPLAIGTKIQLFTEKGSRPDAAFIFHLNIPFKKNDPFQSEYVGTDFRVSVAHTLSERFSLSYNLGGEWDGNAPAATGIYTLALGMSIAGNLSGYIESYGFLPQGSEPDHRLDGGFTYLIARNIQADVSGGIGISDISPDYFIGAGISFRLPK